MLALARCSPPEHRLDSFDMVDLPVGAMFQQLAVGLEMPYVLELRLRASSPTFDVHLKNVTARDVLADLTKRDPKFQAERRGKMLVMWPSAPDDASSPYSATLASFKAEGGVGDVLRQLMEQAGHPAEIRAETAVGRRAVKIDVENVTARDVLALVAEQAHAAIVVQPGLVSVRPLHLGVDKN